MGRDARGCIVLREAISADVASGVRAFARSLEHFSPEISGQGCAERRHEQAPANYGACVRLALEMGALFKRADPARWRAQVFGADRATFRIPGTPFGTLTINRNVAVRLHMDRGGYFPEGAGVMACFREGRYGGGEFEIPRLDVAIDLQDRDVVIFDPGLMHGARPIRGLGEWERITVFAGLGETLPVRFRCPLALRSRRR